MVDNQALAEVVNGQQELKHDNEEIRQALSNTMNNLPCFLWNDWITREAIYGFIVWRSREMNCAADYFANRSMDNEETRRWTRQSNQSYKRR